VLLLLLLLLLATSAKLLPRHIRREGRMSEGVCVPDDWGRPPAAGERRDWERERRDCPIVTAASAEAEAEGELATVEDEWGEGPSTVQPLAWEEEVGVRSEMSS
jgi:hypothetical protein